MKTDTNIPSWGRNLWNRVRAIFVPLEQRVTDLEEGGGGYITTETDPTVPSWAKQSSKPTYTAQEVGAIPTAQKGAASGVAELDASGHVPSSQLPSYVDDVMEYASSGAFPATGETGKIYIATDTNLSYRWTGSGYAEISPSIALGETSSTAYRGDRGKIAYDHAQANGSAFASGLYKITTNAEGHVISAVLVQKSDITNLGIPGEDTHLLTGVKGQAESAYRQGDVNLTPANIGALPAGEYSNVSTVLTRLVKNTDVTQANNGLSTPNTVAHGYVISASDGEGHRYYRIDTEIYGNGNVVFSGRIANKNANDTDWTTFRCEVTIDKAGNVTCFFSHPNEILQGLNAKSVQTPVTDPTASGSAISYIDSITQDAQGVINPTKKTIPDATQSASGLMSAADKIKLDGLSPGGGGDDIGLYIDQQGYICQRIGSDT